MGNLTNKLKLLRQFFKYESGTPERQRVLFLLLHEMEQKSFKQCYKTYVKSDVKKNHVEIVKRLYDMDYLKTLPKDTLGYCFYEYHSKSSGIDLINLGVETLLGKGGSSRSDEFLKYLTALHDLTHVVNGYRLSRTGEMLTIWFQSFQDQRKAFAWLTYYSILIFAKRFRFHPRLLWMMFRWLRESKRHANQSTKFLVADWINLIEKPITEVREQLNLPRASSYLDDTDKIKRTINNSALHSAL